MTVGKADEKRKKGQFRHVTVICGNFDYRSRFKRSFPLEWFYVNVLYLGHETKLFSCPPSLFLYTIVDFGKFKPDLSKKRLNAIQASPKCLSLF